MMNNKQQALELFQQMVERGWKPYGTMISSPLFDDFLNDKSVAIQLAYQEQDYQKMRAQSDNIGLAKLGL